MRGDWVGRIIIGGVLAILSILVIPAFVLFGYLVEVARDTIGGGNEPPEFANWGELLKDGLIAIIISLVYSAVPVVVIGGISAVLLGGGSAVGGDGGGILAGFGILSIFLLIPIFFLIYYIVPAAISAYADQDSIGAAFSLNRLKPVLLSSSYVVAVLFPIIIGVAIQVATAVLAITVVGLVLVPFLQFYGNVAVFRMFGNAYQESTNAGPY
jgi:hypothetical protein